MGEAAEDRSEAASSADRNPLQAHEQAQVAGVEAGAGVHRLERAGGAERRTGHDGVGDPCRHRADEQERYAHGAHRIGEPQQSVDAEALDNSGQPDPAEELAEAAQPTDDAGGTEPQPGARQDRNLIAEDRGVRQPDEEEDQEEDEEEYEEED